MTDTDTAMTTADVPTSVQVSAASVDVRLSPNEMRAIKATTGRDLSDLVGDASDEADRIQTIAWLKLRRDGVDVTWDDAGDVLVEFVDVDPTNGTEPTS